MVAKSRIALCHSSKRSCSAFVRAFSRLRDKDPSITDVDEDNVVNAGSACILAAIIDKFADWAGDRFEIHMSAEAAARRGFGCRVAHGLLVQSSVDGLKNRAPVQFPAQASFGWNWPFREAVITGDTISASPR